MSLENKIEILQNELNESAKYDNCSKKIKCKIDKDVIIIEKFNKINENLNLITKAFIEDIDIIILRERAKNFQAKNKINEHK